MTLENILNNIGSEETSVDDSWLSELSDINLSRIEGFSTTWSSISEERRTLLIERLIEMAKDQIHLNYNYIFKYCLDDVFEIVRQRAIEGLWECEDRSLIPTLCALLKSDPSSDVRGAAAKGLAKFADLANENKILRRDSDRLLTGLLSSIGNLEEDMVVRSKALVSASVINHDLIEEQIKWAYESDILELQSSAICSMGRSGDPSWLPCLIKELESSVIEIKREAVIACGCIEEPESVPHLLPLIDDDDLQVQIAAIYSIGNIGGSPARKILKRIIQTEDILLEEAARSSLVALETLDDPIGFE